MARPLRIFYPGAWYRVMNRGAGYRLLFRRPTHYKMFLSLRVEHCETSNRRGGPLPSMDRGFLAGNRGSVYHGA